MNVSKRKRGPIAEINVVPYIDVMLVLLVIFMITAPLMSQGVKVDLPQAAAKNITSDQQSPIIVTVDAKGQYFLNIASQPDQPIAPQALLTRVAAELTLAHQSGQKRPVMVKGDRNAEYGQVVGAMVLLQQAGAADVGLITEPGEETAKGLSPNSTTMGATH